MMQTLIKGLETPRLRLRTWRADDLDRFAEINADPRVMAFFPAPLSREETRAMIERLQVHQKEYGFCFWAADLKETGQLIGMIGLNRPRFDAHFTPCVEIGWRLHPSAWKRGLATEGALACLQFGWEVLGLDEMVSFTPILNEPSIRVMQRIHMTADGTFVHPALPAEHVLQPHVIYRIKRPKGEGH